MKYYNIPENVPENLKALGMTQQMWEDWLEGDGNEFEAGLSIVNRYLTETYGQPKASELERVDGDSSYVFVAIVANDLTDEHRKYVVQKYGIEL